MVTYLVQLGRRTNQVVARIQGRNAHEKTGSCGIASVLRTYDLDLVYYNTCTCITILSG